jgi:hypothetical protein
MVDPMVIFPSVTAVLGAWELLTGRGTFGSPRGLSQRGLRLVGAYSLALSLVVIALDLTYPSGLAFMTYGIGILALVATIHLVTRRRATN